VPVLAIGWNDEWVHVRLDAHHPQVRVPYLCSHGPPAENNRA
jgi:hypothetical protein